MKVDYIIVGCGLAGLSFSKELEKNNKSYIVFENNSQNSSLVAGGMYNPVILKRFTPVWNAIEQLKIALPFYKELEKQYQQKYDYKLDIYRTFKSIEEQNNWYVASDKPSLSPFMIPAITREEHYGVKASFGYGKVTKSGRIDVNKLLSTYKKELKEKGILKEETFLHSHLYIEDNNIDYKEITANKIVFCEGYGVTKNPFFSYLPLTGTKGELITIEAPKLNINFLLKSSVFVLPIKEHTYIVGATFNWTDKTLNPTEEGKQELVSKLKNVINVPFRIIEHKAGIRPTTKDRRPLVGTHPKCKNVAILNGLGTRGVMIAPTVAKQLFNYLEKNEKLDSEINILRFS